MRRVLFVVLFVLFASNAFAADRWIPIAGTVSNFRTDSRIYNPSGTKAIEISAYFLPVGATNNVERISGTPVKINVPIRSQVVLDDVVASVFNTTGIGAILFTSPDEFVATSRIYATTAVGTLGQFSEARSPGLAFAKGVVIQLKSSAGFRTNVGAVNIANATTEVTWNIYDKTNKKVSTVTKTMAAYEVLGPSNVAAFFPNLGSADLSDAVITYQATNPIFAYGSVIDNLTTDPVYVPMAPDPGSDPVVPVVQTNTVTVIANSDFTFDINSTRALKAGEKTKFRVVSDGTVHGFALFSPSGQVLMQVDTVTSTPREQEITLPAAGRYDIICTTFCGEGHGRMTSSVQVSN